MKAEDFMTDISRQLKLELALAASLDVLMKQTTFMICTMRVIRESYEDGKIDEMMFYLDESEKIMVEKLEKYKSSENA